MKRFLFITSMGLLGLSINAQNNLADSREKSNALSVLKAQGKLTGNEPMIHNTEATKGLIIHHNSVAKNANGHTQVLDSTTSTACNCWVPRDTTFHVVPFDGSGGSGGPGAPPNYANDDWSTLGIVLPFTFSLYGTTMGDTIHKLYINNNGNITFNSPYSTFSSVAFPTTSYTMVAPFWGDVETTNPGSGYVYYQLTPTHLIIQWDSVECYQSYGASAANANLHNTFQLIITDGIDSILPGGNNISFCYGNMEWTTGDASSGSGTGFGGTPATVGVNKGDGTNYVQLSRFGANDTTYTNPAGSPVGGVHWLSNKAFYFNTAIGGNNIPPIEIDNGNPCQADTLVFVVPSDSSYRLSSVINGSTKVSFIGPEPAQQVSVTVSSTDLGTALSVNATTGSIGTATYSIVNNGIITNGYYNLTITATDNGAPQLSTTLNYVIQVVLDTNHATSGIKKITANEVHIYPNPSNGSFVIEPNSTEKQLVQVIDVTGKTVLTKTIAGKTFIDASSMNEGVYNISIISTKGVSNKKIVIVK